MEVAAKEGRDDSGDGECNCSNDPTDSEILRSQLGLVGGMALGKESVASQTRSPQVRLSRGASGAHFNGITEGDGGRGAWAWPFPSSSQGKSAEEVDKEKEEQKKAEEEKEEEDKEWWISRWFREFFEWFDEAPATFGEAQRCGEKSFPAGYQFLRSVGRDGARYCSGTQSVASTEREHFPSPRTSEQDVEEEAQKQVVEVEWDTDSSLERKAPQRRSAVRFMSQNGDLGANRADAALRVAALRGLFREARRKSKEVQKTNMEPSKEVEAPSPVGGGTDALTIDVSSPKSSRLDATNMLSNTTAGATAADSDSSNAQSDMVSRIVGGDRYDPMSHHLKSRVVSDEAVGAQGGGDVSTTSEDAPKHLVGRNGGPKNEDDDKPPESEISASFASSSSSGAASSLLPGVF